MLQMFSDLRAFRRDPLDLLSRRGDCGEALPRLHLGPHPIFLVADCQAARDVLRADETQIDKGQHMRKLSRIVGWNSVTMSGPRQRDRRAIVHRLLAEGMSGDYLARFAVVLRSWTTKLGRVSAFDAHETSSFLALRIIADVLFGPGALTAGDEATLIEALRLVEDDLAVQMFRALPAMPWTARLERRRRLQAREMMRIVIGRASRRAPDASLLKALRDLGLQDTALHDELLMELIAGHHTTGAAAAWALYHIASDADLASGLAAEAAEVADAAGDIKPRALRSAGLSRAVVQEVLRLYPSVHWFSRDLACDQTIAGRHLRRGTTLLVSQWHFHRSPRFWPDPAAFRLDRDWTGNPAYIPFGFGPRACTGMSVASLMLQLLVLEFAATFHATASPAASPRSSITLVPPPITISLMGRRAIPQERTAARA